MPGTYPASSGGAGRLRLRRAVSAAIHSRRNFTIIAYILICFYTLLYIFSKIVGRHAGCQISPHIEIVCLRNVQTVPREQGPTAGADYRYAQETAALDHCVDGRTE